MLLQSRSEKNDHFSIWYDIHQGWCIYQWWARWESVYAIHHSLQILCWIIDLYFFYKSRFGFVVHKLEKFSSNPGKVNFEGWIIFLRYIRNDITLGLNYYDEMKDPHLYELFRKASINTENKLMFFSDYIWKYCPDNCRSTRKYIIFYLQE